MDDNKSTKISPYLPKNSEIEYLTATDGMRLRVGFFPSAGEPRASILLLNGHREFLEKYSEFIEDFQKRGFDVYSMDHRGQGLSGRVLADRKKSHNPDFDKMVTDIEQFVKIKIKPDDLDHPFYIVAHSLGSLLALHFLHDQQGLVDRAVLLSPFTDLTNQAPLYILAVKCFFWIMNAVGFGESFAVGQAKGRSMIDHKVAFSKLTHDQARYDRSQDALADNPELFIGGVTYGGAAGTIKSLNKLARPGYVEQISTPILCLLSEDEQVVNNKTTISLMDRMKQASVEYIAGARHEIYRESDEIRAELWQRLEKFLG